MRKKNNQRRVIFVSLFFFANLFFWLFVLFNIYYSSVPYTPVERKASVKSTINFFTPQAWGFFTKNPRDEEAFIYEYIESEEAWVLLPHPRNGHIKNFFGLSKSARINSMEISVIKSHVMNREWLNVRGDVNDFIDEIDTVQVDNRLINPRYVGDFILELKKPIPWAWSNSDPLPVMPSRIVYVQVKESNETNNPIR